MSAEAALAARLADALAQLIAVPSPCPPGDSVAICAHAAARLRAAGYEVAVASRRAGVDNVVARRGSGSPSLVFNSHVDTVAVGERAAWASDPFTALRRDGRIFGLGAANCKASMAVQLWLAGEIARRGGPRRGELVFTFVGDEESLGPDGMRYLREAGLVRPDILILGAPTDNQPITAERGVLWARVATTGRAAHAGDPAAGDNAILRMVRVLAALDRQLGATLGSRRAGTLQSTMSVGRIAGGHNTNVVPSACSAELDRRLLPDEDVATAFAELRAAALAAGEPAGTVEVTLLTGTNGFRAPAGGPGVAALAAAIRRRTGAAARFLDATGVSDGRYFADAGIEIVNFGPGAAAEGHAANESVAIAAMVDAALILREATERLLGMGQGVNS